VAEHREKNHISLTCSCPFGLGRAFLPQITFTPIFLRFTRSSMINTTLQVTLFWSKANQVPTKAGADIAFQVRHLNTS